MTHVPNATTEEREGIEITPEMIKAGAKVFWEDPILNFSPSEAEFYAERVIRQALSRCKRIYSNAP